MNCRLFKYLPSLIGIRLGATESTIARHFSRTMSANQNRRRNRVQGTGWAADDRPRGGGYHGNRDGSGYHGNRDGGGYHGNPDGGGYHGNQGGGYRGNSSGGNRFTYQQTNRGGPPHKKGRDHHQRSDQVPKFGEVASRPEPAMSVNLKRVRMISKCADVNTGRSGGLLYWMNRDQRTEDNWAFLYAQELALRHGQPLHACFCLVDNHLGMNLRHYTFMMGGLEEVEQECHKLSIPFHVVSGSPGDEVCGLVEKLNISGMVTDFTPLKPALEWLEAVKQRLPDDVPLYQVDTHNVVPCWEASSSQAGRAFIMRGKIEARINEFFTEFPKLVKHPHNTGLEMAKSDFPSLLSSLSADRSVAAVDWAVPGMSGGRQVLQTFLTDRLPQYGTYRNNPEHDCVSNLSPWFHFGHISPQRCILEVKLLERDHKDGVEEFFKEAVVWREMSDNFCFHNTNYDNIQGAPASILASLRAHAADPRQHEYSLEELENARTHDDLWNAAQIQMVREGKMHTFFRTYWGKKILEWAESPELAHKWALHLNDKYNLDGNDPNGYAGVAWCVLGVHDRDFPDRPVTGKVRTMSYRAQFNKFDVKKLVNKYGAKAYNK